MQFFQLSITVNTVHTAAPPLAAPGCGVEAAGLPREAGGQAHGTALTRRHAGRQGGHGGEAGQHRARGGGGGLGTRPPAQPPPAGGCCDQGDGAAATWGAAPPRSARAPAASPARP